LRRNARLRKEYVYRKALEEKDKLIHEKKRKIKEAIEQDKPIPTELKHESLTLRQEIELEDEKTQEVKTHIDDEYARAGIHDPKILLTTSRDPSSRLLQFAKELRLVFPHSQLVNRGRAVVKDLVDAARTNDFTDVIVVHEHRGEPDGLIVSHLPYGPTAFFGLSNCVLRHDLPEKPTTVSEAYPHLIFHNFNTSLGRRVRDVLRFLFPVPKDDSRRLMTFSNDNDFISFRHHLFKRSGPKAVDLSEQGPRFEMRLYQLRLGTLDMAEAENEWILRPYMNTAKRQKKL